MLYGPITNSFIGRSGKIKITSELPSAIKFFTDIHQCMKKRQVLLFLDFDGTLTPLIPDPNNAFLSASTKALLNDLAPHTNLTLVSGRALADLKLHSLLGPNYVGNHGLEIEIRGKIHHNLPNLDFIDDLKNLIPQLTVLIQPIPGCFIENKKLSLTIHYRQSPDELIPIFEEKLAALLQKHPRLKLHQGKKVFEIRPNLNINKGTAVNYVIDSLYPQGNYAVLPIYIGDDLTDEDGFEAVNQTGISIVVANEQKTTHAHYVLQTVAEVLTFLELLNKK